MVGAALGKTDSGSVLISDPSLRGIFLLLERFAETVANLDILRTIVYNNLCICLLGENRNKEK